MALTTYNLTVTAHDDFGAVVEGAIVEATLVDQFDKERADHFSGGSAFPITKSQITDASGVATLALLPNTAGTKNTRYRIEVFHPVGKRLLQREVIQMTAANSTLETRVAAESVSILGLVAGDGIAFTGNAIGLNVTGLSAGAEVDTAADRLLLWDASAGAHVAIPPSLIGGGGGGASALGDLSDVDLTGEADGHALMRGATEWGSRALATGDIQSGTFSNARISEASVTQHEGALTITEAQISDLGAYITAAALSPYLTSATAASTYATQASLAGVLDGLTLSDITDSGTAAAQDVGTTVGDVVQLVDIGGGTPGLPAIDGSQLTGVSGGGYSNLVDIGGGILHQRDGANPQEMRFSRYYTSDTEQSFASIGYVEEAGAFVIETKGFGGGVGGTQMRFNVGSSGTFLWRINGSDVGALSGTSGWQVVANGRLTQFGGGFYSDRTCFDRNGIRWGGNNSQGYDFDINPQTLGSDVAPGDLILTGQSAYASATTNLTGGAVTITAGAGTGAGDGGALTLTGGAGGGSGARGDVVLLGGNRAAKINDPSGGSTVDTEARTAINAILDALESHGLAAAA